jgi:hypothetical protein
MWKVTGEPPIGIGRQGAEVRIFVRQHHQRLSETQLGMADPPVRRIGHPEDFRAPKALL